MKAFWGWSIAIGLILRLVMSQVIYSGDLNNHIGWAKSILSLGSRGAYDREYVGIMQPTYPPLSLYNFTTSQWLYDRTYSFAWWLNKNVPMFPSRVIWLLEIQNVMPSFHKILTIVCDIGIALLVFKLARGLGFSKNKAIVSYLLALFNPVVWYISSLWGQIESVAIFFVLLGWWYSIKSHKLLSIVAIAAALLTKQSTIILIPIYGLWILKKWGLETVVKLFFCGLLFMYGVYSPFWQKTQMEWPISVYIDRIETGSGSNFISDHAFNPWAIYSHLEKVSDKNVRLWGILGFVSAFSYISYKFFKKTTLEMAMHANGLIVISSFLLMTRMHERYLAPVLPFLAIFAPTSVLWFILYSVISFGHQINLYNNWWVPTIQSWVSFSESWWTIYAVIISLTLSWAVWLYKYKKL